MYIEQKMDNWFNICDSDGKVLAMACSYASACLFYENEMKRRASIPPLPFIAEEEITLIPVNDAEILQEALGSLLKGW